MGNREESNSVEDWFGRRVREERELRGWTQQELAARLHDQGISLHPSAIAKIELRDVERPRTIRLDEAKSLAEAFGVDLAVMLLDSPSAQVHYLAGRIRYWVDSQIEGIEVGEELVEELKTLLDEIERDKGVAERQRIEYKLCASDLAKLVDTSNRALLLLRSKLRHPGRRGRIVSGAAMTSEVESNVDSEA
ncbi:transcriptional regulator with XRE-family HTH domain [Rhodococcus sp. 27YEA15]|uniref:helix-turn-helix domain-containing protein n=1 Tax=Rhodococcus sp. 27YEA15 TaxID=3156259 RepID=UPI003C798E84